VVIAERECAVHGWDKQPVYTHLAVVAEREHAVHGPDKQMVMQIARYHLLWNVMTGQPPDTSTTACRASLSALTIMRFRNVRASVILGCREMSSDLDVTIRPDNFQCTYVRWLLFYALLLCIVI
jgi:hypothetical protein